MIGISWYICKYIYIYITFRYLFKKITSATSFLILTSSTQTIQQSIYGISSRKVETSLQPQLKPLFVMFCISSSEASDSEDRVRGLLAHCIWVLWLWGGVGCVWGPRLRNHGVLGLASNSFWIRFLSVNLSGLFWSRFWSVFWRQLSSRRPDESPGHKRGRTAIFLRSAIRDRFSLDGNLAGSPGYQKIHAWRNGSRRPAHETIRSNLQFGPNVCGTSITMCPLQICCMESSLFHRATIKSIWPLLHMRSIEAGNLLSNLYPTRTHTHTRHWWPIVEDVFYSHAVQLF